MEEHRKEAAAGPARPRRRRGEPSGLTGAPRWAAAFGQSSRAWLTFPLVSLLLLALRSARPRWPRFSPLPGAFPLYAIEGSISLRPTWGRLGRLITDAATSQHLFFEPLDDRGPPRPARGFSAAPTATPRGGPRNGEPGGSAQVIRTAAGPSPGETLINRTPPGVLVAGRQQCTGDRTPGPLYPIGLTAASGLALADADGAASGACHAGPYAAEPGRRFHRWPGHWQFSRSSRGRQKRRS